MLQAALCGTQGYRHGYAGANERSRQGADMTHSDTILSLPILSVGLCLTSPLPCLGSGSHFSQHHCRGLQFLVCPTYSSQN